jgi:purine-binding chemotaxis protein CheW
MAERHTQYLAFLVGDAQYATPILKVREIVPLGDATRVPATPPWIRGVVNLRGQVLPVIDLAVKFGLPPTCVAMRTCVIVFELEIESQTAVVGALVDAVSQVLELGAGDIEPAPAFGTQIRSDYLVGASPATDRFVLLLDTERVLCADEVLAPTGAGPATEPQAAPSE